MTGYHQPAEPKWTLSLIILKLKKKIKKNPAVQHKILIMRNYLHSPLHFLQYHSLYNPSYVFQHTSSPSEEYAIDQTWACVCARMCVFMYVCVSRGQTALSLCFYIPALLLLAPVWGPISQLCWRSINPDRSIVPRLFTGSDQRLALRYHFQLEKHSWARMEVDLKGLQQLTGGMQRFLHSKKDALPT